jgi:arylsulfatase A-like enzyme
MKRRDFLKSTAAVTGGGLLNELGLKKLMGATAPDSSKVPGPQPNILFFLVDELRFPSVFPAGIKDAGEFLHKFMPNLHKLWKRGVKFGQHHNAANACTPSRGVIITGLYSQQNWLLTTILASPTPTPVELLAPALNPNYPTYGKLLRRLGYETPYRGKWHVSIPVAPPKGLGLSRYGFQYGTYPDPTGYNLQGTYGEEPDYHNDAYTATQAIEYLSNVKPGRAPFCLTVGFVNPHDREFFPTGTEFQTVNDLFASPTANPAGIMPDIVYSDPNNPNSSGPNVTWEQDALKCPPDFGYPEVPPNWETEQDWEKQNKPSTQAFVKKLSNLLWGGAADDPSQSEFTIAPYTTTDPSSNIGGALAPYSYWRRGMDSYTQIMQLVDCQIGRVMDALHALPQEVIENTVVVFTSDHGEYNGAHGLLQGKIGTLYEEAWHVPLIVVDPSGRFVGDIDQIRTGLTSHVDLMPFLVSLGDKGSTSWMTPELSEIYGLRHDMISMLKSNDAPGRDFVLLATDEITPAYYNPTGAPTHMLGLRTQDYKFGISADWLSRTTQIDLSTAQLEFYDYATKRGRMELENTTTDPRANETLAYLLNNAIPNELQQALPPPYRAVQVGAEVAHLIYRALIDGQPQSVWQAGGLRTLLAYGADF